MIFSPTQVPGAYVIELERRTDDRGFFARAWCRQEFADHGLNPVLEQINVAFSPKAGTLRGLHYQLEPHQEAKLVRCTMGAVYDVAVDLRPDSPTRTRWVGAELTATNRRMLYVPEGFAHGYLTLVDDTEVLYQTSAPYAPHAARGVRYDDAAFGIEWPQLVTRMSDADRGWPDFVAASGVSRGGEP